MKTTSKTNRTGNVNTNAQTALADINRQIAALQEQRVALAQPLKERYGEIAKELADMAGQIRELDPSWKPQSVRPKVDTRITEILTASERPMTVDEILAAVGSGFSKWKVTSCLNKKSKGAKAVFALNDGRYSLKAS